jgi:DNA repair exonuclease SbcCD ATPase subunit
MILQKLEVEGFRCFDAMVTLVLDPHKINILHGNNGSGKSSLFSALLRGLLDSHKVGGKGIAELCPWGTQLSPRISVVFEHYGQEYRVCKTFLRQKGTRLERKAGKTFRPIANNEQADEQLRELLLAGAAGTGLAKPEGWGLAQALWCAHDQLAIPSLQGQALNSVHEILGAQFTSPDSMELIGAIKESYLEYYAESGKVRGGKKAPAWVSNEQDATRLKQELSEATERLEELQSAQKEAQELQRQRDSKASLLQEAITETKGWSREASAYVQLEQECKQRKAEWDAKCQEAEATADRVNRISELSTKLEQAAQSISLLSEALIKAQSTESIATARERQAAKDFEQAQVSDPEIEKLNLEIKEADAYLADVIAISQLESTIDSAQQWQAAINNADSHIRELNAPAPSILAQITHLSGERNNVATQLESALLHVDLAPADDQWVSVRTGEPAGHHQIVSGSTLHITGSPAIELELSGFGSLQITGPNTSAGELRQRRDLLSEEINILSAPFETSDAGLLQTRRHSADDHERAKRDARVELNALLRSQNLKDLGSRRQLATEEVATAERRHPAWAEAPPDVQVTRNRSEALQRADQQRRMNATQAYTTAKDEASASVLHRTTQEGDLANARKAVSEARSSLMQLRTDGLSDEDRDRKRTTLAVEAIGSKEKYEGVQQELSKPAQNPRVKFEYWEAKRQKLEHEFSVADHDLSRRLGILSTLLDQAPYERQVRLEEELETIQTAIERDRLRSESLKLLYETVRDCEHAATEGVAEPIAEQAAEFLKRISGQSFSPVLDTNLVFENIGTPNSGEPVSLGSLSGGEQQQAYLAVRLALADLLTRQAGKRELVVLDDVFANTDEERLKRFLEIISEMREHVQFLILTCHPERYSSLKDVKRIDMERLRAG